MSPSLVSSHVMLPDVSVIDFAMDVDVWKCLFNWFPVSKKEGRPPWPRERLRLVHQPPEISKYLCCDPHLSIHSVQLSGSKTLCFWEDTRVYSVYAVLPAKIYPKLSGSTITHINSLSVTH